MQANHSTPGPHPRPLAERFWSKVLKTDTCWLWQGGTIGNGYGTITSGGHYGRTLLAHHVSWEWAYGPIPNGLWVLHKCDVPPCVNPEHLWLGTHSDNMQDRARKGRANHALGEAHGGAKLTNEQVISIRARYGTRDLTCKTLAIEYGVSATTICLVANGRIWRHLLVS